VSFMTALQLFNNIKWQLISLTGDMLKHVINESLEAMVTIGIGMQKRKNQPRAIKRRPKAYPLLTVPREEACKTINYISVPLFFVLEGLIEQQAKP